MATKLTFEGVDTTVELEDHAVTLTGATTAARTDDNAGGPPAGEGPVVIPRWEIASATVKSATLLGYGTLTITTNAGLEYAVRFSRDAEDRFGNLAEIIG
ncbi:hypothetical protein [Cellulomonas aerilata]|uniref:Uncharacterized protein n=1 Tax=Cellulomonas aerilata TaxID=515326 RepID=A0A512D9S8_9CELL|nr:hypothetical protein [Cellulomonas aerilata]GEO33137.1 hypothetical protein CAE01nite_08620 [Cellulomonas aerilata]